MKKKTLAAVATVLASHSMMPLAHSASVTDVNEIKINHNSTAKVRMPLWAGGALLVWDANDTGNSPDIRMFDRTGRALPSNVVVEIPGAASIAIYHASRGANGSVAVCGLAIDKDGRRAPFLAIFSSSTALTHLIRTESYHPYRVAVSADGTIWTQGVEALDRPGPGAKDPFADVMKPYPGSGFIRRFDANGTLLGSHVSQGTVKHMTHLMGAGGWLVTANNRAAWYCRAEQRYVEVGDDGAVQDLITQLPGNSPEVEGIALTDSGNAFAAVSYNGSDNHRRIHVICMLDREAKTWVPVSQGDALVSLYGADGDVLVGAVADWATVRFVKVSP